MERQQFGNNNQNGNADCNRSNVEPDRSMMHEIVRYPIMRGVLGTETLGMYPEALRNLGVPEEDVARNTRSLADSLNSPRNHVAERIDAVYQAKKAAERYKSKIDAALSVSLPEPSE